MQNLLLADPKTALCDAWASAFRDYPKFQIFDGRFEQIVALDYMVSAANSCGLLDGGVDLAITNYFGDALQVWVQQGILAQYNDEPPVGTSFSVETGHPAPAGLLNSSGG